MTTNADLLNAMKQNGNLIVAHVGGPNPRFIVTIDSDVRECKKDGDHFVHVLNSSFRIHESDTSITSIRKATR